MSIFCVFEETKIMEKTQKSAQTFTTLLIISESISPISRAVFILRPCIAAVVFKIVGDAFVDCCQYPKVIPGDEFS